MVGFIRFGDLVIFEPVLVSVVYATCLLALILGIFFWNSNFRRKEVKFSLVMFFISYGVSALLGATTHGFFPNFFSGRLVLWKSSLIFMGLASLAIIFLSATNTKPKTEKKVYLVGFLIFVLYQFYVTTISSNFKIALLFYSFSLLFLFFSFYELEKKVLLSQVVISFIGILFYFLKIDLFFNYRVIYHFMQGLFLLSLFFFIRKKLLEKKKFK